ncbi:MAG: hypothetical protein EXR24_00105 [Ignavibacteria bacterium]|nr:hypothetical protein [Ignavibacteria bacterium]
MKKKIAIAQVDSVVGDVEKNIKHHVQFVKEAIKQKAEVVLFPELSLTGYSIRDLVWDVAITTSSKKILAPLLELSSKIEIIIGCVEEGEDFGLYNSAFLLKNKTIKSLHKKLYLPTYGMFEEGRYFTSGKNISIFDEDNIPSGILICEDLWHIVLPYAISKKGAQIIYGMSASPTRKVAKDEPFLMDTINTEHYKTYSRLLSCYIVVSNRVGIEDGINFWGGSSIIDPFGKIVAKAKLFDEDLIVSTIDDNQIRRARRLSRHFLDDNLDLTLKLLT